MDVEAFEFGGMKIRFVSERNRDAHARRNAASTEASPVNEPSQPISTPTDTKAAAEMDLLDREMLEDALTSQMLIDDPLGYEKYMVDRDIENRRQSDMGKQVDA